MIIKLCFSLHFTPLDPDLYLECRFGYTDPNECGPDRIRIHITAFNKNI